MRVNGRALEDLTNDPNIVCIAHFVSSILATYIPKVYNLYLQTMDGLLSVSTKLRRVFPKSPFFAATFNFGPQTVCLPHRDIGNLAWGWCTVTALGNFDPDTGGALVLWDLGLVIRFPPGSTIDIPSALLRHSNLAIGLDETRYSFTQFSAGGIFRYVYNGYQTDANFMSKALDEDKARREEDAKNRWQNSLDMFSRTTDV